MSKNRDASRRVLNPPSGRPLLVYDGDCTFCRRWVERRGAAAKRHFDIESSQTAAARFPELAPADFEQSVQLIDIDGRVFSGAEAVLRVRALAMSRGWLLSAYAYVPGFAPIAEAIYRAVARHRPQLWWLTRIL